MRSTTTIPFPAPPAAPLPALPGWRALVALPAQGLALARREQGGEAHWIRVRTAADAAGARRCPNPDCPAPAGPTHGCGRP